MVQSYPFPRANPSDYSPGQRLPSADANIIDKNAAQAANGLWYSDVALIRNFGAQTNVSNSKVEPLYEPLSRIWYLFGDDGTNRAGYQSQDLGRTWVACTIAGLATTVRPVHLSTDGAGTILMGYNPGASSSQKAAWTSDNFATIANIAATGPSNTSAATRTYYSARLGMWFIALGDGSLYSCTGAPSGTWTQRIAPSSSPLFRFAESADRVMVVGQGSTAAIGATSLDGATWTSLTMPASPIGSPPQLAFCPNPSPGQFVLLTSNGSSSASYASADGAVWTLRNAAAPRIGRSMTSYGRMIVALATNNGNTFQSLFYSLDMGATWKNTGPLYNTGSNVAGWIVVADDQFMLHHATGSGIIVPGFAGGF